MNLFDSTSTPGPASRSFANASTTRAAAGVAIKPTAARLRARVLEFVRGRGDEGATDKEIQQALDMSGDTERPRRWELQKAGLIVDSGQTRLTPSGRAAVVWKATAAAAAIDTAHADQPEEQPPF